MSGWSFRAWKPVAASTLTVILSARQMGLVSEMMASLRSCDCSDGTRVAEVREEKLSLMMKIFCLSLLMMSAWKKCLGWETSVHATRLVHCLGRGAEALHW